MSAAAFITRLSPPSGPSRRLVDRLVPGGLTVAAGIDDFWAGPTRAW